MTLRARLTSWFTLAVAVATAAYGAFVYVSVDRLLVAQLGRDLYADYERAEQMLVWSDGCAAWDVSRSTAHIDVPLPIVEIVGAGGRVVERSTEFVDDATTRVHTSTHEVWAPDMRASEKVVLRVARPLAPLQRELNTLLLALGGGLVLGVVIAAAAGAFLARRALAPVAAMADRAQRITADALAERLPVPNAKDELGRLAVAFNDTLARLEASFERLRRFTADASHELRTPLTAIRAVGEMALRESRSVDECRAVIASMLEEADHLTRLVDELLSLSRADAGEAQLAREDVDLGALAREVAEHLVVLAEEKGVTLDVRGAGGDAAAAVGPVVRADRTLLRRAVVNLVDNAIQYSPAGASVRIAVERRDGTAVLQVVDQGPGIAPEHHARIFDRFYRVDPARARQSGGTGLGLAIARWAVTVHGGSIELASAPGAGSAFRIVLRAREG